jgi:ParB family chromosome partitioning protein
VSQNVSSKLGKGLDSLLPIDLDRGIIGSDERIQKISLSKIAPNPDQPRKNFDHDSLLELADSIAEYGVLQPIIVLPEANGRHYIVAGERRWRASGIARLKSIPVIVRARAAQQQLEIALIENIQRVDLSPLEQAISIRSLRDQFGLSYKEISKKLSKSLPTINNTVRLLKLPPKCIKALEDKLITEGHARAILALKQQPEEQEKMLELIISGSWSVRQAEQYVTAHKEGISTKNTVKKRVVAQTEQTKKLSARLGKKVTVYHTAKGGRLQIYFKNDEELSQLYSYLNPTTE